MIFKFALSKEDVDAISTALEHRPFREVIGVIQRMQVQLNEQLQAKPKPPRKKAKPSRRRRLTNGRTDNPAS